MRKILRRRSIWWRAIGMTVLLVSNACGPSAPVTPIAQATIAPTGAAIKPTSMPVPTIGVPAPTVSVSPTPAFDPKFCPLTGLPADNIDWPQRRAILVQIGNSTPERPQSQLALADVVFETIAEGGITRFSAVYLCTEADNIGPVRSGRLIDLDVVPMMNAIFVHVGASDGVMARFAQSDISQARFDEYSGDPGVTRITTRKPPFNAYTSTDVIWSLARDRNMIPAARPTVLKFNAATPTGGHPAAQIDLPILPGVTDVSYIFDAGTGRYLRSMDGFAHSDLSAKQQLSTANVVIIYAPHIASDIIEDSLGSRSIQIDLTSGGRMQLLRDGQVFDGTWTRPDAHAFFELKDSAGNLLSLRPGNTWIQFVPIDFVAAIK